MVGNSSDNKLSIFNELESNVRSYIRNYPTVFTQAQDHLLWDEDGKEYIDFLSGAGTLNYGHNNEEILAEVISYLKNNGILHSLDMATSAKKHFLEKFNEIILLPRKLDYKIIFPGPTGTNSVEVAIKTARKVKKRTNIISFTNAFHGMSLGSLSVTGNKFKRAGAGVPLHYNYVIPYENYLEGLDTISLLRKYFNDNGSGVEIPAAIILETVQGEGGLNTASDVWVKEIRKICDEFDIVLIIDEIQTGCGRTGEFFSFENAQITPDIVCLSKSIGGIGFPMSLTLIKPEYDLWQAGEHNGTFRGNNLGFVAAGKALDYWKTNDFKESITKKSNLVKDRLNLIKSKYPNMMDLRGKGLMQGIVIKNTEVSLTSSIVNEAFNHGLIIETSGPNNEVIKLLPPLTISELALEKGLDLLEKSISEVMGDLRRCNF